MEKAAAPAGGSADVGSHTRTSTLRVHRAARDADGGFVHADELVDTTDEPGHDGLCRREQEFLLRAIRDDFDLGEHLANAVNSLRIVLAADAAPRTGRTIEL